MDLPQQHLQRVECEAFVLLEKKSLFYGAKWQAQRLALSHELLEFSPRPQVVLRYRDALYVVLRGCASADEASKSSDKQKLLLDVRSMEDVRKSWVYQTAAKTSRLDIYVDSEHTRECILTFANNQSQPMTARLHDQVPLAVPVAVPQPHPQPPRDSRDAPETVNLKLLIEESFQALADAQACMDSSHGGAEEDALSKYRAAGEGFERAAQLVPDERTRQLFSERRQDIQRVIHSLEESRKKEQRTPNAVVSLLMGITGVGFPDAPLQPPPPSSRADSTLPAADTNATAADGSSTRTTASELDERLERLKNFAAQQEVERAQRERKPAPDALRLRLQALRNEKSTTPSAESLEERFQRLRGLGGGGAQNASSSGEMRESEASLFERQSSVDRIIQQVQDEIALGIVDDELEEDDDGDSGKDRRGSTSGSEEDGDSERSSSGDDSNSGDRQQRRGREKSRR